MKLCWRKLGDRPTEVAAGRQYSYFIRPYREFRWRVETVAHGHRLSDVLDSANCGDLDRAKAVAQEWEDQVDNL